MSYILQQVLRARGHENMRTVACVVVRDLLADAHTGAGDQHSLARHHICRYNNYLLHSVQIQFDILNHFSFF